MSTEDKVIGVAVLDVSGAYHWLHYFAVGHSFEGVTWNDLPVLPVGAPHPAEPLPSYFPENRPWRYRIEGDMLHVTPSVNIGNNWWHNAGSWSVRFVMATAPNRGGNGADQTNHLPQLAAVNTPEDSARLRTFLENRREMLASSP